MDDLELAKRLQKEEIEAARARSNNPDDSTDHKKKHKQRSSPKKEKKHKRRDHKGHSDSKENEDKYHFIKYPALDSGADATTTDGEYAKSLQKEEIERAKARKQMNNVDQRTLSRTERGRNHLIPRTNTSMLREHLQVPALADQKNKLDKAVAAGKDKWETFKFAAQDKLDDMTDRFEDYSARNRNNCCVRNVHDAVHAITSFFTPVRLRSDSEIARELDAELNSTEHTDHLRRVQSMTKREKRIAERAARDAERELKEQERSDRELAAQLHGAEVTEIENRLLRREFGTLARIGSVDYMRSKHHYPYFCYGMSFVLIIVFIVEVIYGGFAPVAENFALGPPINSLVEMGAKKTDLIKQGDWWRLFTPMFLHAGVIHVAFNLFGLRGIGSGVEQEYGSVKVAIIYFTAGLFGVAMSASFIPNLVSVGASGAIFGLFGACWADLIQNWSLYRENAKKVLRQLSMYTIINLLFGFLPVIDNFQHLGGMVCGFFAGLGLLVHKRYSIAGRLKAKKDYQVFLKYFSLALLPFFIISSLLLLYQVDDASRLCPGCTYISCIPMPPNAEVDQLWWGCDRCLNGEIQSASAVSINSPDDLVRVTIVCPIGVFNVTDVQRDDAKKQAIELCREKCI